MPIRPSTGAGYTRRPADALWPRHQRPGAPTRADRMPLTLHVHVYEQGPTDPVAKGYHMGSLRLAPALVKWLDDGPLPEVVRQQRLPPRLWWQNRYLLPRLERHLGADGVRAAVHYHRLHAAFAAWERDIWDEQDDDAYLHMRARLERALAKHAATCCGGGHNVAWLERLAHTIERHVWQTYYPSHRARRQDREPGRAGEERSA